MWFERMETALFGKFRLAKLTQKKAIPKKVQRKKVVSCSVPKVKDEPSLVKKTRKRSGCFCCRKRRIKCTGLKPTCDNCQKASYVCVWPNGDESLPHNSDFKLVKVNEVDEINGQNMVRSASEDSITSTDEIEVLGSSSPEAFGTLTTIPSKHRSSEIIEDALFRKFLLEINSSVLLQVSPRLMSFPYLSPEDTHLYDAFVNGFITDISPQLAHFKLQPASAFIPSVIDNSIVQGLFFASGAAFLYSSTKDIEMKRLASRKFIESANQLNSYISNHDITGNSDWIIIYLLVAYLKLRFVYEGQRTETLGMISIIEVMKIWLMNKQSNRVHDVVRGIPKITELDIVPLCDDLDGRSNNIPELDLFDADNADTDTATAFSRLAKRFKLISSQSTLIPNTVQNPTSIPVDPTSVETEMYMAFNEGSNKLLNNPVLLPYERTMIESFAFNYSSLIFVCEKSLIPQMTSPFVIFDMLRPYLSVPIYKCAVPWMNHPVVGAALPIFELQAKVCWLGHFYPLSEENKKLVSKIRSTVNFYTRPILPTEVHTKEPENVQKKLLESCYAAEFVSKAVFIYSTKLLYPDMEYDSEIIQTAVEQAYQDLLHISIQSQIHMILGFAFVVVGSVAIQEKHREYLTWKLKRLASVFCVSTFDTILNFYDIAWSRRSDGTRDRGWDTLNDAEAINGLVI